jgi:hypothetical protein
LKSVEKHQTAYTNMPFATEIRPKEVTIPKTWIFAEGEAKVDAQQIINNIINTSTKWHEIRWQRFLFYSSW